MVDFRDSRDFAFILLSKENEELKLKVAQRESENREFSTRMWNAAAGDAQTIEALRKENGMLRNKTLHLNSKYNIAKADLEIVRKLVRQVIEENDALKGRTQPRGGKDAYKFKAGDKVRSKLGGGVHIVSQSWRDSNGVELVDFTTCADVLECLGHLAAEFELIKPK